MGTNESKPPVSAFHSFGAIRQSLSKFTITASRDITPEKWRQDEQDEQDTFSGAAGNPVNPVHPVKTLSRFPPNELTDDGSLRGLGMKIQTENAPSAATPIGFQVNRDLRTGCD
jgi:hypothetical protein